MTKYYAIRAYEDMFQGLNGICEIDVVACQDDIEAIDAMNYMAEDVYYNYCEDEYPDDELVPDGDIMFIGENLTSEQIEQAKDMAHNDFDELYWLGYSEKLPWQQTD